MRRLVTKVDIVTSDDGGECSPECPFFSSRQKGFNPECIAFHIEIINNKRAIGCMGREDATYQIPVVEE